LTAFNCSTFHADIPPKKSYKKPSLFGRDMHGNERDIHGKHDMQVMFEDNKLQELTL
jgi:hypothetical protein